MVPFQAVTWQIIHTHDLLHHTTTVPPGASSVREEGACEGPCGAPRRLRRSSGTRPRPTPSLAGSPARATGSHDCESRRDLARELTVHGGRVLWTGAISGCKYLLSPVPFLCRPPPTERFWEPTKPRKERGPRPTPNPK